MSSTVEPALGEQFAEGLQSVPDALRVVEPVDAEHDRLRVAEARPGSASARACTSGERASSSNAGDVDRDRERLRDHPAGRGVVGRRHLDERAAGRVPEQAAHRAGEVAGIRDPLEADHVGAEQSLDDLVAPRQLREDPVCRERDVVEEADRQIGALLAQHRAARAAAGSPAPRRRRPARSPRAAASAKRWLTST